MAWDDFQKGLSLASRIGVELAAGTLVGTLMGYGLDRWLSTGPWLMLGGLALGTFVGFRNLYRIMNSLEKDRKDENGKST